VGSYTDVEEARGLESRDGRVLAMRAARVAVSLLAWAATARAEEKALFNGRDLTGWTHVGSGEVVVEHGLLKTVGGMGLLFYAGERFGDCTIRVVYRTTTVDDNSGIFIRIPDPPKDAWQAVHTGYEIQILENFPASYVLSDHQKKFGTSWHTTGAIYSMSPALATPPRSRWASGTRWRSSCAGRALSSGSMACS